MVYLQTGDYATVATDVTAANNVNAIGYNVLDDYLYGIANPSRQLVRISSAGASSVVATFDTTQMADATANVGDIDGDGHFWFGSAGRSWYEVDLVPGSPTYGTVLAKGTANLPSGLTVADWVYVPAAGAYLWTVARASNEGGRSVLLRFSLATKEWEVIARYSVLAPGGFGALYGINNGTLYASNNQNGEIWAFDVLGSGVAPYLASSGPVSGSNDGARCVTNMLV
ncbi:hypothetical protein SLS62_003133 [Diatrype stigma]|uniref:DUF6923 domain-containing protein n=1 Tax=Diatrype stigma TaxID=117547 RepID=A0AAN9YUH8_9PEZI